MRQKDLAYLVEEMGRRGAPRPIVPTPPTMVSPATVSTMAPPIDLGKILAGLIKRRPAPRGVRYTSPLYAGRARGGGGGDIMATLGKTTVGTMEALGQTITGVTGALGETGVGAMRAIGETGVGLS